MNLAFGRQLWKADRIAYQSAFHHGSELVNCNLEEVLRVKPNEECAVRRAKPYPRKFTSKIKKWLTESPLKYSRTIDMINRLALLNEWRKMRSGLPYFDQRLELYDYLSAQVIGDRSITYLEFGVYQGASIRYWAELNKHSASEFIGFDTFEGLPEEWDIHIGTLEQGHFTTKGQLPAVADERMRFIKGLFQDTLPKFLKSCNMHNQLVINNDSDLYSSTLYTLCTLNPVMVNGTIVIFDEFSHALDEFRALEDYTTSFRRQYEVLGASGQYYDRVAIRFVD
jgi:O-methyltransferase